MKSFNEGLLNKLDHNKEWVVRKDYQIWAALANDEENNKLNFIEYLQIFNVFLKHLGYKTRFLWAFESKSLEEYGFLDVRRISKSKKNQQARFASLKAKLYNKNKRTTFELMKESGSINICPSFTKFVKMQENIEENEEIRCELRKIETSSKKTLDFLDKFAFNSSRSLDKSKNNLNKSNLTLSQSSARCTKRFVNKKSVLAKIPQSNLFVTSLDDALPDNEEIKCSDEISKEVNSEAIENNHIIKDLKEYLESDDEKENTKQKVKHKQTNGNELMKNLWWIEVLNTKTNKWIIVDLLNNTLIHSRLVISNWIEENSVLFLFAVGNFTFQKINGEISDKIYMKDVTLKYWSYFQQMLAIKNTLYLQDKIQKEIEILASFFNNAWIDEELKKAMEYEEKEIYNLERYYIPEKYNGFRSHRHFVLESLLGKYQSLKPGVEPFNNMRFKNEPIYLRSDVINLHTKEQWRRLRREVKPGERFIKKVKGNYNDKDKMALLYGAWQTEIFEIKLNKDGSLPSNDHGNIEVRSANDVPKGAQHLKIKKGRYIWQKLGIQYREAMTGFETGGHGFSYPVIEGVIVLDKDVQTIMDEFNRMEEERIKREIKKRKSEAKDTWKMLIKKICVKRYTARLFEREPEDVAMDIPLSFK